MEREPARSIAGRARAHARDQVSVTGYRSTRLFLTVFLLAGVGHACLFASEFPQADRYFATRDKSAVVVAHPDKIALQPAAFRGKLIEVRGVISGQARRDGGTTFIINTPDGRTYLIDANPTPEAELDLGHTVRALARTNPASASATPLLLVAIVSEYEAAQAEVQRARQVTAARTAAARAKEQRAAKVRARGSRRQLASRSLSILGQYRDAVLHFNRRLSMDQAERIARSIIGYSNAYGLDARLVMAVVAVESNFNAGAVSPKGAMGLGQLMPGTAQDLGVQNPWSPEENLEGATRLLRRHLDRMRDAPAGVVTEEQLKLALACYNAGLGAVKKYGGVPPYRETKNYVRKVTRLYRQMCGVAP